MGFVNINVAGGVESAFKDAEAYQHRKSYWARVVRKDGLIEYRHLKAENHDDKKLDEAIKKGDVHQVMFWEEKEIGDIKEVIKRVIDEVKAALVMAHIQKKQLHELLKKDERIGGKGFPKDVLKKLEGEGIKEIAEIDSQLKKVANMLLGESNKG